MKCLGRAVLIVVAIGAVVAFVWFLLGRSEVTADLAAIRSDVQRRDAKASQQESVPAGEHRKMRAEDGVKVDNSGRAKVSVDQCVWEIYHDTGLTVQQLPEESAPACVVQLTHGTIDNKVEIKTVVNTDWAVVTALGTHFLVYLDPDRGLLWVLVLDGIVEVEANNVVARLTAGEQTWVFRGGPPEPPQPAIRSEADEIGLPPVKELTDGELADEDIFLVEEPMVEAPRLSLEQSTDEVLLGECTGPHTIEIMAHLTGGDEALANVARAVIHYQWEGSQVMIDLMKRVDDQTYFFAIDPPDDCCTQASAEYWVEVLDASGEPLVARAGKFVISSCIE